MSLVVTRPKLCEQIGVLPVDFYTTFLRIQSTSLADFTRVFLVNLPMPFLLPLELITVLAVCTKAAALLLPAGIETSSI